MRFLLACIIACVGGYIGKKSKIPAGIMLVSMIFVAIFNIFVGEVSYPYIIKFFTKILAGILIGLKIDKNDIKNFKKLAKPLCFYMVGMLVYTTTLALLLSSLGDIDIKTALFACTPGGLSDMTLLAESYGANVPQVVLIQTIRLVSIICIFPPICTKLLKKNNDKYVEGDLKVTKDIVENKNLELVKVFIVAFVGGTLGYIFNMPAGEMLGSMFFTVGFRLMGKQGYMYPSVRNGLQVAVGLMIGTTITYETAVGLLDILDITLASVGFVLLFGLTMGWILHKTCGMDLVSACLGCAPGGIQEISLMAEDLNAKLSEVTTLHIFRLITVLAVFPFLIQILMNFVE